MESPGLRTLAAGLFLALVAGAAQAAEPVKQGAGFTVDARRSVEGVVGRAADGSFVVAYVLADQLGSSTNRVLMQRYDTAGLPSGGPVDVAEPATPAQEVNLVRIAMTPAGSFSIVWIDYRRRGIFLRSFAASGTPAGATIQVDNAIDGKRRLDAPTISVDPAGVVRVFWVRTIVRYDYSFDIPPCAVPFPCLTIAAEREKASIVGQRFGATGAAGAETIVASSVSFNDNLSRHDRALGSVTAAADVDGGFAVAWLATDNVQLGRYSTYDTRLQLLKFNADGAPFGDVATIDEVATGNGQPYNFSTPANPSLASSSNGYALFWKTGSLKLQRFDRLAQPLGAVIRVPGDPCATRSAGHIAASDAAGLVLTYACTYSGERYGIRAFRYAADGTALGGYDVHIPALNINQGFWDYAPQSSFDGAGNFVTIWTEVSPLPNDTYSDFHVRGQRYAGH